MLLMPEATWMHFKIILLCEKGQANQKIYII